MFEERRRRRAARRVEPGDGRPLKRFRWWQVPFRALLYLPLTRDDGGRTVYAVDVRHWQNQSSGDVKAHLYLDGRQHAVSKLPAVFPVRGGSVEVSMSAFGLKRCHYVTVEGAEYQLAPDPGSAEGRRARFERSHPVLSRGVGLLSAIVLAAAMVLIVVQVAGPLTQVDAVSRHIGGLVSPIRLPVWLNIVIGICTVAASTERALRLRHSRLLDGAAG
ncbi:hypothetical protein [Actinomadura sp. WMMB 499]|uniref:hypothetical protein n=1 Tax=Actinomadura sp. WMMB 499 TaxID=1219491 RepID=UPI001247B805|nr:hypothetical protein [Actinomadura sp. WMMB 499]QFG26227.1 hypothetical protein F7P10_38875 [Actinomadura sp. WMMB 499]